MVDSRNCDQKDKIKQLSQSSACVNAVLCYIKALLKR